MEELPAVEKWRYRIKMVQEYNLISPERKNYCVCSVLQAILDKNGINMTQDEITDILAPGKKKSKIKGFKLDDENLVDFMKANGFNYKTYWRNQVLLNDIEFVLEEMKDREGIICMDRHAYLFADYNGFNVILIEPCKKEVKTYTTNSLDREMRNSKSMGSFGLIKKLNKVEIQN